MGSTTITNNNEIEMSDNSREESETVYACSGKTVDNYWCDLTAKTLLGAKQQASKMYDSAVEIEVAVKDVEHNCYETVSIKYSCAKKWTNI